MARSFFRDVIMNIDTRADDVRVVLAFNDSPARAIILPVLLMIHDQPVDHASGVIGKSIAVICRVRGKDVFHDLPLDLSLVSFIRPSHEKVGCLPQHHVLVHHVLER